MESDKKKQKKGFFQEATSQNAWRDYDVREDIKRGKNNEKLSPIATHTGALKTRCFASVAPSAVGK